MPFDAAPQTVPAIVPFPVETPEQGARFLDLHWPGWAMKINVAKLDMSHDTNCVLGQLFGRATYGVSEIRAQGASMPVGDGSVYVRPDFAFAGSQRTPEVTASRTAKWRELVLARQLAQA